MIISSNKCTFCISPNNTIYSFGKCDHRSHGHEKIKITIPTEIKNTKNVKMISCGEFHTAYLTYDGEVYTFGSNMSSQLGIKDNIHDTYIPQKIDIPYCIQILCGYCTTCCLTIDNLLYIFGHLNEYPCNITEKQNISSSSLINPNTPDCLMKYNIIADIEDIKYITGGFGFLICKTLDNRYISFGSNTYGQLGRGFISDNYNSSMNYVEFHPNIIDIKCGKYHTLLLTKKGYVYSFGENRHGQLGLGHIKLAHTAILIKGIPEIKRIECGHYHSILIDINNYLWIFGRNDMHQLGIDNEICAELHYYRCDKYSVKTPHLHPEIYDVIDISSGGNCTFVKTQDNKIYGFGDNIYYSIGKKTNKIGDISHIITPDIWHSTIVKNKQKSARK